MPHDTSLIATLVLGFGVAFFFGMGAARLGLPPLIGYLIAGIAVGPFTPGVAADQGLAQQLAEFGVILMFGVGLHFSIGDLMAVRRTVVPGALAQTAITGSIGAMLALAFGWGPGGAVVLALSLGVASTVVLLKGLEARDRLDSPEGRLAVGWLVVEDLSMVLALVLLPALVPMLSGGDATGGVVAPTGGLLRPVAIAIAKVLLFAVVMFVVGRRAVPWMLERVARLGSRELFTLAVLATALGVGAVASTFFGISFALGAFFAGAVVAESDLAQRAAADALPLQDAFAVLFFVSVGMLFDPRVFVAHPVELLALVSVVVIGKFAVAFGLVRLLGHPPRIAIAIGAALGQIGEFSFIVAALGVSLGLLAPEGQALIVAVALIAITLNGPVLSLAARASRRIAARAPMKTSPGTRFNAHAVRVAQAAHRTHAERAAQAAKLTQEARRAEHAHRTRVMTTDELAATREAAAHALAAAEKSAAEASAADAAAVAQAAAAEAVEAAADVAEDPFDFSDLVDHVILVGHGRVGSTVAEALARAGEQHVVIEEQERIVGGLRKRGERAIHGDATRQEVLARAGFATARLIVVTSPEPIRARRIIELSREQNPDIVVAVRTHSATEQAWFEELLSTPGARGRAVYAEREAALSLAQYALLSLGHSDEVSDRLVAVLRGEPTAPTEMFKALQTREYEALTRSAEQRGER